MKTKSYDLRILTSCLLLLCTSATGQVSYPYPFNPVRGLVHESETPYRDEICLNGLWQFMPVYQNRISAFVKPGQFVWDAVPIKIPSPWNVNSFAGDKGGDFVAYPSYPREWENAQMGWMRKRFTLPDTWKGKRVNLHFGAIAGLARIYVNEQFAGENLDIFFPTEIDISPLLQAGENEIVVGVAKASLTDKEGKYGRRNYVAGSFWGQHIAGIWQDVYLTAVPEVYISDVFVQPEVADDLVAFAVSIKNHSSKEQRIRLNVSIREWRNEATNNINQAPADKGTLGGEALSLPDTKEIRIKAGDSLTITTRGKVDGKLKKWTTDSPNLYGAVISLKNPGKNISDIKYTRFGWRQFTIEGDKLLLNGEPIRLKGDSWHFMGIPQMSRRYAWGWYQMLKDAHANAVRLHAQPFPSFYLDVADEMGICVLDETGIWSSDGGPKMDSEDYWAYCREHVKNLVLRDRNHPSVFGWSVCNETLPVAINVFRAPENIVERQVHEINQWVNIVRQWDPTRNWISGDGEDMRPTNLPTVIGHYGDENSMKEWSSHNKPWGVGETGMAYYGTPKQVAIVNAGRAYESQLGRMEGLATEAYDLIGKQAFYNATYSSIFNIIWYALKPLAFGLSELTRPPHLTDGVFFPAYNEGVPGVQPERLGPYTSTINPGYDPQLPMYEAWPLFYAVQAANANPPQAFRIEEKPQPRPATPSPVKTAQIDLICGERSELRERLLNLGVSLIEKTPAPGKKSGNTPAPALLLIDGATARFDEAGKKQTDRYIQAGAKILIWGVHPQNLNALNKLLPFPLELTERKATSFLIKQEDEIVAGLNHEDFYFTELTRQAVMSYGLSGEAVRKGIVIAEACNTDWSRWNGQAEYSKTGSVYRSERESKPEGAAIVKISAGQCDIYISSMDLVKLKVGSEDLFKSLLTNLGVLLKEVPENNLQAFSEDGFLERALMLKNKNDEGTPGQYDIAKANPQNVFSFGNRQEVWLSFRIYSPRSLSDLLSEPDMPQVDLLIEGRHQTRVYVNGHLHTGNPDNNRYKAEKLILGRGWNHILLHLTPGRETRNWSTNIRLESNRKDFIGLLKSSVGQPGD
ncbi:MAG: glycoside hydrolase family 2 [Tannerellaceae bacterium]|nr:glycoside hydrolase family 2 [Tannerellaceae bacterium]